MFLETQFYDILCGSVHRSFTQLPKPERFTQFTQGNLGWFSIICSDVKVKLWQSIRIHLFYIIVHDLEPICIKWDEDNWMNMIIDLHWSCTRISAFACGDEGAVLWCDPDGVPRFFPWSENGSLNDNWWVFLMDLTPMKKQEQATNQDHPNHI